MLDKYFLHLSIANQMFENSIVLVVKNSIFIVED